MQNDSHLWIEIKFASSLSSIALNWFSSFCFCAERYFTDRSAVNPAPDVLGSRGSRGGMGEIG